MEQLLAHLIGDYLLQTRKEALYKNKHSLYTLFHAVKYVLPFLFLTTNIISLSIIGATHFVIDRFKLANKIKKVQITKDVPECKKFFLMTVIDNTIHLLINYLVLTYI